MFTHIKTILLSIVIYLILLVMPINVLVNNIEEQTEISITSDGNEGTLIGIWIDSNVLSAVKSDGFVEVEPGHFVSNAGNAELVVKRQGAVVPYFEMISNQKDVILTVSRGIRHFEYQYLGNGEKAEKVLLTFETNNTLIHLICWGILAVIFLLLENKLKNCKVVLYCRVRKAFLLVLLAFMLVIVWKPLSAVVIPVSYTIQNTKNINGSAVSNIWIDNEMFQVVSLDGYEEIEKGHFVSYTENSQIIIKKKLNYEGDFILHMISSGEGAYHIIKNRFEFFTVDSYNALQPEAVAVSLPPEGKIWLYVRMVVFFILLILVCVTFEEAKKIWKSKGRKLSILGQNNAFIDGLKAQSMIFGLFTILFMAAFGMLFRQTYCADSFYEAYGRMLSDKVTFEMDTFGRPIATLIGFLLRKVIKGYPHTYNSIPSLLIFMLASVISCCIVYNILKQQLKASRLGCFSLLILADLMVLNPLMCDLAMFNGARSTYVWGIPAALWAAKKFLEKKKISLITILFLMLSLFTYQACGAYFIILCCIGLNIDYIQSHESGFDKMKFELLIKRYASCAACYIISCVVNRLWLSLVVASRQHYKIETASSIDRLSEKWNVFCGWVFRVVTTGRGYMTSNVFLFVMIAAGLIFLLIWYCAEKVNKRTVLLATLVAVIVSFSSIFYFQFFMQSIWIDARTCTALMGLPAVLIVPSLSILEKEKEAVAKRFQTVLAVLCLLSLLFSLKDVQINNMRLYAGNVADYERSKFYLEQMEEYEKETGNDITQVYFWTDENPTWCYRDYSNASTRTPGSVYEYTWSRNAVLSLMSGKVIKEIENIPDTVLKEWEGKNWDTLDEEQVICIGNRAYIALY